MPVTVSFLHASWLTEGTQLYNTWV